MSATINLKKQVDLPVFEWLRPLPAATSALSCMTTANSLSSEYIYYLHTAALWRYSTSADSWQQLANSPYTASTFQEAAYSASTGHYGRAISAGGGNNTIELAGLCGEAMAGYKIRIVSGTGAGQERTITAVSKPIVKDRGVVTTASPTTIFDASTGSGLKQWAINQYRDHQVRIDFGSGVSQVRNILYNTINTIVVYDINLSAINPWWGGVLNPTTSSTAGVQSLYVIESHVVTVDADWDVNPDSTSNFLILSGGIWQVVNIAAGSGGYGLAYYDVLADVWYYKSNQTGNVLAVPTDIAFERYTEFGGAVLTGTATSGGNRSLTSTGLGATPGRYANFELRITGGTGAGQSRSVITNGADVFYITKDWGINPDNTSTFSLFRDVGKLMLLAGSYSSMFQYSADSDQWTTGKQLDYGAARHMAASQAGSEAYPIGTITRAAGGIIVLNPTPTASGSGYLVDQILTITTGGTLGTARITAVNSSGGVTAVTLETCGSGYTTGTGKVTTVSPAGGTGCTLDITTTGEIATGTTALNHSIKRGSSVTISGATPSGYNGVKTVLAVPTVNTFQYDAVTALSTPATFTAQAATTLVDSTKNWAVNEHAGKLVQLSTPGPSGTGQVRRITANTATTLTFSSATAPVNGTSRYVIFDSKPFGTEVSIGGVTGGGNSGLATGGSTTSLIDSTKNWPVNFWSTGAGGGRKVRITEGTGAGSEIVITSNTATTLNFASQSFSPDTTTQYVIMDNFGVATGGSTTTLIDTTQNWPVNIWAGKRVKFISGTGQGNEYAIVSNTSNTLTFATATAPDTTTHYAILQLAARGTGIHLDSVTGSSNPDLNNRYLYAWRGGATSELARYDFTKELFDLFTYFPSTEVLGTGSMYAYNGEDRIYFTKDATGRIMYYDVVKNIAVPAGTVPYGMGTAVLGNRMELIQTADSLKYLYLPRHAGQEFWRTLVFI